MIILPQLLSVAEQEYVLQQLIVAYASNTGLARQSSDFTKPIKTALLNGYILTMKNLALLCSVAPDDELLGDGGFLESVRMVDAKTFDAIKRIQGKDKVKNIKEHYDYGR